MFQFTPSVCVLPCEYCTIPFASLPLQYLGVSNSGIRSDPGRSEPADLEMGKTLRKG